jgi:hypothetical protein
LLPLTSSAENTFTDTFKVAFGTLRGGKLLGVVGKSKLRQLIDDRPMLREVGVDLDEQRLYQRISKGILGPLDDLVLQPIDVDLYIR